MKKVFGLAILISLVFGVNSALFAQDGPPPPPKEGGKMGKRGGPEGRGGMMQRMHDRRGGKRGMRGKRGGMRGGGFGIPDGEIFKLNLTDAQKIKLFDFRKKMMTERESMMKDRKPGQAPGRSSPARQGRATSPRRPASAPSSGGSAPGRRRPCPSRSPAWRRYRGENSCRPVDH